LRYHVTLTYLFSAEVIAFFAMICSFVRKLFEISK